MFNNYLGKPLLPNAFNWLSGLGCYLLETLSLLTWQTYVDEITLILSLTGMLPSKRSGEAK